MRTKSRPFSRILFIALACALVALASNSAAQEPEAPTALVQKLQAPDLSVSAFILHLLPLTKDELSALAAQWQVITRESVKRAAETNIRLSNASEALATELRDDLESQMQDRNRLLRKFGLILDEWTAKGATEDEVAPYRKYALAVLASEFRATDPKTIVRFIWHWLLSYDGGMRILIIVALLAADLLALNVIAVVVARVFRRALSKRLMISELLRDFLVRTAYWIIFVLGAALIATSMGFNLTPLLAAFGGASFIIGFAAQSTLSNLASGILLMVSRPFDVGDHVEIGGVSGTVEKVTTISTVIRDAENQIAIVPNKKVWDGVIVNKGRGEEPSGT